MLPLVSIPSIVEYYGSNFESFFSGSEYKRFKKYLSGLLVSENKTVEGMNRLFTSDVEDQSSLNRFLTASTYDIDSLNQARLDWLNTQEQTRFKSRGAYGGVLSIDDTLLTHYGKSFEKIAKLKDHSNGEYVWAHNLVNLHYSDDETDLPTYFKLWEPISDEELELGLVKANVSIKEDKKALKIEAPKKWRQHLNYLYRKEQDRADIQAIYKTKIHIGKDLLEKFYSQYPDAKIPVCFDKWFTNPGLCSFITNELGQNYVVGIKSNQHVMRKGSTKITLSEFAEQLKQEHLENKQGQHQPVFKKTTIKYKGKKEVFYNYCKTHTICGYGKQKLLISFQKEDLSGTARIFICNCLTWRVQQITRVGRHRWPVEEYHKEGKAEGLNQYQIRNFKGIYKHIAFVALTYSLLKYAQHDQTFLDYLQTQLETKIEPTLPFFRRTIQAQCLWVIIEWVQKQIELGSPLQEVFLQLKPAFGLS